MKLWTLGKKNKEVKKLQEAVNPESISRAYETRKSEIESLRKYDRGEKTIVTPNIKTLVRGI